MDAPERRRSSVCSSPEFEFWPVHAHADPAASPSCADELFADGVLLPLPVLLPRTAARESRSAVAASVPKPETEPEEEREGASVGAVAAAASIASPAPPAAAAGGGGSKRWTDIFGKKPTEEKEKRKDGAGGRRSAASSGAGGGGGGGGGGGSELNINIWPFSRSRSADGSSTKPRPPLRKASSAPCSRSNSRGEAASSAAPPLPPPRRWAASPGRAGGGVPVGRSSPVWQIKRPATRLFLADQPADRRAHQKDKPKKGGGVGGGGGGGGMRGINLSVNSCIGYRHQVSCRRVDAGASGRSPGDGGLFGIRGFFSKKVH